MSTRGLCSHGVRVGAGFECATCVTTPAAGTPDDQPFSPLVGAIFTQMFEQSASITTRVMDNYATQAEALEAELYAIRQGVSLLLAGPYMPMPDILRRAVFYPAQELIDEYKANKEVGW